MANYTKKAVFGTGFLLLMTTIASAIAYAGKIILARTLQPADYGLYYAVFTFILFFLFLKDLGLGSALVKFIPQFQVQGRHHHLKTVIVSAFTIQMISSLLFAGVVFFASGFLAEHYFKDSRAIMLLRILLLYVFGSLLYRLYRSIFNGFQNIKVYSVMEFMNNAITFLLLMMFLYLGLGIYAPAWANILTFFLMALILLPFLLKTFPFFKHKVVDFWPVSKELLYFGLPLFASSLAGKFIGDIDTLMLTYFSDLAQVGIYNVIYSSATMLLFFGSALTEATFPMMVKFWMNKDLLRLTEGLRMLIKYTLIIFVPPSLCILIFSDFFIKLFFGSEYLSGTPSLQILIVGMLLFVVAGIYQGALIALGRPKDVAKIIIVIAVANVVANLILIPSFGITGAALANTLSFGLGLFLFSAGVAPYLSFGIPKWFWLKHMVAGVILAVVGVVFKKFLPFPSWVQIVLLATAGTALYLLAAYLLKLIDLAEIKKYVMILRKKGAA